MLITTFLVSPYLIRNYKVFNELVLTKSFGYNLLKGNYKEFKVEGNPKIIEKDFKIENLGIKTDKYFEINLAFPNSELLIFEDRIFNSLDKCCFF